MSALEYDLMTNAEKERTVLMRYHYWSLLEFSSFFAQLLAIILYVITHTLSPFSVYQYYLLKLISNSSRYDAGTIWCDEKPSE